MHRYLPLALIFLLLIVFRFLGSAFAETMPNFQPIAALFFCGACLVVGRFGWVLAAVAWLVTYPIPAILMGKGEYLTWDVFLTTAVGFGAVVYFGRFFRGKPALGILLGSVGAAVLFHVITNGAAWVGNPIYAKNLSGLWQSLWAGSAVSTVPSWVFLRNMGLANVVFTGLMLAARLSLPIFARKGAMIPAR